jgi:hypothetical protein
MSIMTVYAKSKLVAPLVISLAGTALITSEATFARGADTPITFTGGAITLDVLSNEEVKLAGKTTTNDEGQIAFFDFDFNAGGFAGDFTINAVGASSQSHKFLPNIEKYGKRINNGGDAIELYDFSATSFGDDYELNLFYHTERYHWGWEGDFFGIMKEGTDKPGADLWNDKVTQGFEIVGKGDFDGLKVVAGPEIYWGAKPKTVIKYMFGENDQHSFVGAYESEGAAQTSLNGAFNLADGVKLEVGGLISGQNKVGETYDYVKNGIVYSDTISTSDTLGFRAKMSQDMGAGQLAYVAVDYAGLVADSGIPTRWFNTKLPYSESGNKTAFEAGINIPNGSYLIIPRVFYRDTLVDAGDGAYKRWNNDPFIVSDNRAVMATEISLTYDPTPATHFFEWDNDVREDADLAYNIGFVRKEYTGATDSLDVYWGDPGVLTATNGRPAEDLWELNSRVVMNTASGVKTVVKLEAGLRTPNTDSAATEYRRVEATVTPNKQSKYKVKYSTNDYGAYDWYQEQGFAFAEQLELSYVRELVSGEFGVKYQRNTWGENTPDYNEGMRSVSEVQASYTYKF